MNKPIESPTAVLRQTADLLDAATTDDLAPLVGVHAQYSHVTGTWRVTAQLRGTGSELERINAVRAWALALDGVLHVAAPFTSSIGGTFSEISATTTLATGVTLKVWDHIGAPIWAASNAPTPTALAV
jgi:hypothetical protein